MTNTDLGGFTAWVMSKADVIEMVGMPLVSAARAIRPTDWWQTGQAGTRNSTSTPFSRTLSMRAGAKSSVTLRAE